MATKLQTALHAMNERFKSRPFITTDPRTLGYTHPAAFGHVLYLAQSGAFEAIWNSGDYRPPESIQLADTGENATLVPAMLFTPEHTPEVGDRVIVPITPQRARQRAQEVVEGMAQRKIGSRVPEIERVIDAINEDRREFERLVDEVVANVLEVQGCEVINVTRGWLDGLDRVRREGLRSHVMPVADFAARLDHMVEVGTLPREIARLMLREAHDADAELVLYRGIEDQ